MSTTVFIDSVTPVPAAWLNTINNLAYTTFAAADGVDRTADTARNAIKTSALLASVAGTNTVTATTTPAPAAYASGDSYILVPAITNTAATTLNLNSLGAKNVFVNGAACKGGELVASVPYIVQYDGTQFNVIGWTHAKITNSLGSDVALNNLSNYFDGPSVAQGTVGTWLASGTVTLTDTVTVARFRVKLWDGTTVIDSAVMETRQAGAFVSVSVFGYISNPVGNIRISVRDESATTGVIAFSQSGEAKDSSVTAVRIG